MIESEGKELTQEEIEGRRKNRRLGLLAFPNNDKRHGSNGMRLRDYFAAAALQGMLAQSDQLGFKRLAEAAYDAADEMLKVRETI